MTNAVIADTGPLVALLVHSVEQHGWATRTFAAFEGPLPNPDSLFALVERGLVQVALSVRAEIVRLRALMHRYRDQPMSLAEACLVRLAELHANPLVWTLDSDFLVYRRTGRQVIPTLMPERR